MFVVALGAVVLFGWATDTDALLRVHPSFHAMNANSAVLFVLLGIGLSTLQRGDRVGLRRALALGIVAVATATAVEYVSGADLGIDEILFDDSDIGAVAPGRMSPAATLNFMLLGVALFYWKSDAESPRFARFAVVLALLVAFVALTGYVFGAVSLYSVVPFSSTALHSVFGFIAACTAFFTADPGRGFASIAAAETPAGILVRRLLPALVLGPIVLGWLRLVGEQHGLHDDKFGMAILTVGDVVLLSTMLFLVAARLHGSDEALRANEERFRMMVDAIRDYAIFMLDVDGRVANWNAGAERLLEFEPAEVIGRRHSMFHVPLEGRETDASNELEIASREGRFEDEGFRVRRDGGRFFASVVITPIRASDGALMGFAMVIADLTERKRAESEHQELVEQRKTTELLGELRAKQASLSDSLKEREVLLQEVHHRVKNNLQVISSLVNMQRRQLHDDAARDALAECKARVEAIALIHEELYQTKNFASVRLAQYVNRLAHNVFQTAGVSSPGLTLEVALDEVALPVGRAIPCGLVLNELITNALKHAFPERKHGVVKVELRKTGDEVVLSVADDGVGVPEAFDPGTSASLGMQLVGMLSKQLGGRFDIVRGQGTLLRLTFPAEE